MIMSESAVYGPGLESPGRSPQSEEITLLNWPIEPLNWLTIPLNDSPHFWA